MSLELFNSADNENARHALMQCCTSENWVNRLVEIRPFSTIDELFVAADTVWQELNEEDYLQAFDGHPKIGDVDSLKEKYKSTKLLASNEQSDVSLASDEVITELAIKNEEYQKKFGFIFIVCATGKTAAQMLILLVSRLENDRATELSIAIEEQRQIYHLRLKKLLEESS